jgi:hypothetical protein
MYVFSRASVWLSKSVGSIELVYAYVLNRYSVTYKGIIFVQLEGLNSFVQKEKNIKMPFPCYL